MKEYIKSLKVLWSDERGRAIIKLGVYIIFMMIVVLYARSLYKVKSTPKKTPLEIYGTSTIKEETIRINDDIEYQVTFKDRIKFFNDTKECTVYEETKYACGPIFEEAEIYSENKKGIFLNDIQYNIIFMCRVNPFKIRIANKDDPAYWVVGGDSSNNNNGYKIFEECRPYRILLKKTEDDDDEYTES